MKIIPGGGIGTEVENEEETESSSDVKIISEEETRSEGEAQEDVKSTVSEEASAKTQAEESEQKKRAVAKSSSVTRGGITVVGGVEGTDWEYQTIKTTPVAYSPSSSTANDANLISKSVSEISYNAIVIKTGTPLTLSNSKSTGTCIYVSAGVKADITLAGIAIQGTAPIDLKTGSGTSLHLTLADGTKNTLTASSYFPAIRCGEGSSLTIDDSVRNIDEDGKIVTLSMGKVSRTTKLMNGTEVHEGDRATVLDSSNPGSLNASISNNTNNAAAIGGCCLENSGNLTFNGGIITAQVSGYNHNDVNTGYWYGAAAIGGGHGGGGTSMTFNGGYITAIASYHGAAIGGGWRFSGLETSKTARVMRDAKINNGTYKYGTTTKKNFEAPRAGNIYINGGYIEAKGSMHGNAFGQGCCGNNYGKEIIITGGTLLPSIRSGGDGYDIGGSGCNVYVLGGSVRLSGSARFQSNAGNGYAYGSLDRDKNKLVFMTKIDLSGYGWAGYSNISDRDLVDAISVYIGGEKYEYGMPAGLDSSGALYLWFPKNANGKEVRVEASVLRN